MRPLLLAACAWLLAFASGCIVWHSHLEPGVDGYPDSLREVRAAPIRLQVDVLIPGGTPTATAQPEWIPDPDASERLAQLINDAAIVSEAGTELGLVEGRLTVRLEQEGLGHPGLAMLTALTVGLVPYFGGRRVTASAELRDGNGVSRAEWTSVAEARMVGHLVFLAGWNLDALNDLRDDALRGVILRLAREQQKLLAVDRAPAPAARTVTSR